MSVRLPLTIEPQFGDAPVGSVIPFAGALGAPMPSGASPPDSAPPAGSHVTAPVEAWGWMLCDGRPLNTAQYPELFAALGYLYGGSDAQFNIPDYRGTFMRGTDLGAGVDPQAKQRTSAVADKSDAYDGVGSRQEFATQDHEHGFTTEALPAEKGKLLASLAPTGTTGKTGTVVQEPSKDPAYKISKEETRPSNIAVNFIIKFTYGLLPFPGRQP